MALPVLRSSTRLPEVDGSASTRLPQADGSVAARLRHLATLALVALAIPLAPASAAPAEQSCVYYADHALAEAARNASLGCATGERVTAVGAEEFFELGVMLWRQDSRTIYMLPSGASWRSFADTWEEWQPDRAWLYPPDPELQEPQRGFGKVWREQLNGPASPIGWATSTERGFEATIQSFQNGTLIRNDTGRLYLLHANGTWQSRRG